MDCTVRWSGEGMTFIAETGSNHLVTMDGAPDGGGRNLAPRPMEMVLVGTGGLYRLRRGRDPEEKRPGRARLRGQGHFLARADGSQGVHQDPHAFHRARPRAQAQPRRACDTPRAREVLLRVHHAWEDGRDHDGLLEMLGLGKTVT